MPRSFPSALSAFLLSFALPVHAATIYQGTPTGGDMYYYRGMRSPESHDGVVYIAPGPVTVEATTTPGLVTVNLIEWDIGTWPGLHIDEAEGTYATQFDLSDFSLSLRWKGVWEITDFDVSRTLNLRRFRDGESVPPVPVFASASSFFDPYTELHDELDFTPYSLDYLTMGVNLRLDATGRLSWIRISPQSTDASRLLFDDSGQVNLVTSEIRWEARGLVPNVSQEADLEIIPEPSIAILLATGLAGLAATQRRRQ